MDTRLTYTSDEERCVTRQRAFIGCSIPHGTIFTLQGLCDRVLFIGSNGITFPASKPILINILMNCDSVGNSNIIPDIDPKSGKLPYPSCFECLINAAELLAVCEREKRES